MPSPLVSVIVASYNGENFLADALASLFRQDYDPFEVVFVDDGSTDGTATIARSFPLRYFHQRNQGLASARNCGIDASGGELITFFDDDDLLPVNRLSLQAKHLLEHPELGCVLGRQKWLGEPPPEAPRDPVFGDPAGVPLAAAMLRRGALVAVGGFDASIRYAEDRDLLIRLREHGIEIDVIPEVVLFRRQHALSMTASGNRPAVHPMLRSLKGKLDRERARREGAS